MNSRFNIQHSKLWLTLLVVCGVCSYFVATAQTEGVVVPDNAPVVRGSVEPDSLGIGDRFVYTLEVEKDLVQSIFFPDFRVMNNPRYTLIEEYPVDTLSREGRKLHLRKRYLMAAFQEGIHNVLPQVIYADKNIVDTLSGKDTLTFRVSTFEIDSTSHSIFDIKPQRTLPFKVGEISGYLTWGAIALLIIALMLYVAKRVLAHYGKSFGDIFKPAPQLLPHEKALQDLGHLHAQRLWQQDKHKLYYSTLTDILRSYLDAQFGVEAMEMTTDEIVEAVRRLELPQKAAMDIVDILREADLVKFAKATPEAEQNEGAYTAAWDFVQQTMPVQEQESDEE